MHPDLASLLRYARQFPGDVTAHRVIADWLEENGDDDDRARARFIRIEFEMAGEPLNSLRYAELRDESEALRRAHLHRWLGTYAGIPGITGVFFDYGMMRPFLDEVILRFGLAQLPKLADWPWIDRLVFEGPTWRGPSAREMATSRVFADLPEMAVHGADLSHGTVTLLAGNPAASGLRTLILLDCALDEWAPDSLAGSEHLAGLGELVLTGSQVARSGRQLLEQRFGDRVKF
jgi:uncharacterized protein (TIGR02996 family)